MITASFGKPHMRLSGQALPASVPDPAISLDSTASMGSARRLSIDIQGPKSNALYGQMLQIELAPFPPFPKNFSVLDKGAQHLRESCRIAYRDEDACLPLFQEFGNTVDICGDNRAAGLARLRQYQRCRIRMRWQDEDVRPQEKRKRIVLGPHEAH